MLPAVILASRLARAQDSRSIPVIGYLRRTEPIPAEFAAFRDALKALGHEDGSAVRIEQRHAGGSIRKLREYAAELARINVKVFAVDGTVTVQSVMAATKTIPIVFTLVSNPEALGIRHLNRPGGNVTGALNISGELNGKRLELLKELIPRLRRVAVLINPDNAASAELPLIGQSAAALGVEMRVFEARGFTAWPNAFAKIAEYGADGVVQQTDATFASRPPEIVALAAARRMPVIYGERQFVAAGGLISYGVDLLEQWRRAADYVNRILKGANAAELPIERPRKFELVINLKTARALGLNIPDPILARADEAIE